MDLDFRACDNTSSGDAFAHDVTWPLGHYMTDRCVGVVFLDDA
jgi:hypothetical protein